MKVKREVGSGAVSKVFEKLQQKKNKTEQEKDTLKASSKVKTKSTKIRQLFFQSPGFYEISSFLASDTEEVITIDYSGNNDMIVFMDIAFPGMDCGELRMDILDQMGNTPRASLQKMKYTPFVPEDSSTIYCEDKEDERCCNCNSITSLLSEFSQFYSEPITCRGYRESIKGKGCRVTSHLRIPKMKGNIHFAPGSSDDSDGGHSHQLDPFTFMQDLKKLKLSFHIFALSFGPKYPDMEISLLDYKQTHEQLVRQTFLLELVPTIYMENLDHPIFTHQYSVSNHTEVIDLSKPLTQLPGIFFAFDLSPMLISISKEDKSVLHLLTRLCAVIGGTWVVLGLFWSAIHKRF